VSAQLKTDSCLRQNTPPFPALLSQPSPVFVDYSPLLLQAGRMKYFLFSNRFGDGMLRIGRKTAIFGAIVLALVLWQLNNRYLPFVVTDPNEAGFDAKQFQFWHYSHHRGNESEFNKAIAKMFPPGTDKNYVDAILVEQGRAEVSQNQLSPDHQPGETDYTYISGSWLVNIVFDSDNKTVALIINPKKPEYGFNRYLLQFERGKQHERK
jgi:hypothetical protein